MKKILFVCHGNICRSPMAEFLFKDMVKKAGLEAEFEIASAGVSAEELGNPVYPPARRMLAAHGIGCEGKRARKISPEDYEHYERIIGLDRYNMRGMQRAFKGDPKGKLSNLLDYAGRFGEDVADPWYTGDFQTAWDDIEAGCKGLFELLTGKAAPGGESGDNVKPLDLSACESREALYEVLRREMSWPDWYGENLDALWDVLTGLPHEGNKFRLILPRSGDEAVRGYARRMESVFREAGKLAE